jgi:hypothetical protein
MAGPAWGLQASKLYEEQSVISEIGVAMSKISLGILATITLEVVSFRYYLPFPALLSFFKCILEIVFC